MSDILKPSNILALLNLADLEEDGQIVEFDFEDAFGKPQSGFALRWDAELYAYQNLCPHWSTPLNDYDDGIFDITTGTLVCQTHGARFDPKTGLCTSGPCRGDRLRRLHVQRLDEKLARVLRSGISLS